MTNLRPILLDSPSWFLSAPGSALAELAWLGCLTACITAALMFRRRRIALVVLRQTFALVIVASSVIGLCAAAAALYTALRPAAVDARLGPSGDFTQNLGYILPPLIIGLLLSAAAYITLRLLIRQNRLEPRASASGRADVSSQTPATPRTSASPAASTNVPPP